MDRTELNERFKQILEATVLPQRTPPEEIQRQLQTIENLVKPNVPERLFRFRSASLHSVMSFEHNTITLCSADLFPDRFDSVVYVNKNKIRNDVNLGFNWEFQKNIIDEVRQTGHFPEALVHLYGEANAAQLVSLYTTASDEEIIAGWEYSKEHIQQQILDNISPLATQQISAARQNTETKIACFTEDVHSAHMWDRYADGYRGFALEYDLRGPIVGEETEEQDEKVYPALYPVIYSDTKYDATEIASWNLVNEFSTETGQLLPPFPDLLYWYKAFLYKDAASYGHEREWRFMCTCKKTRDSKFMEITSGNRMKAIYYGPYIATDTKEHLSMWAKRHKITEYDVALNNNSRSFELSIKPI